MQFSQECLEKLHLVDKQQFLVKGFKVFCAEFDRVKFCFKFADREWNLHFSHHQISLPWFLTFNFFLSS